MYMKSIIIAVFALCLSITDARPGAPGNMNAAATGSTYQIEGLRNDISAAVTQDAIGASVATNKAFMASSVGTKAALAASDRSVALKSFDKLNRGDRKMLSNGAAGGMAPGNNNARGTGNTYMIEGQRNEFASAATHDAIYMAAAKVSAFAASAFGTKAAISATERSVAVKAFDKLNAQGNRKLQQTNDRGDLVLLSQQTAHNSILKTVESEHWQASVKAAAAKNMEVVKLANKSGTWAMQFNDNRRHLHQATERDVRAIMSEQQISAQIDKASSGGSVKTATTKGLSFAKLTASISARPAEFSP